MSLIEAVDVTPSSSFNTLQFQNETLNVLISSILVTFILINITSIVGKLIQRAHPGKFSFTSFRRFVIFEGSRNPIRLFKWCLGKYPYHKAQWKRNKQEKRFMFLALPLCAHFFLLLLSVASIAISIPTEVLLSGCERGDFRPVVDVSNAGLDSPPFRCINVELLSGHGTTRSALDYCSFATEDFSEFNTTLVIANVIYRDDGTITWHFTSQGELTGFVFYLQWKNPSGKFNSLPLQSITPEDFLSLLLDGLSALRLECQRGDSIQPELGGNIIAGAGTLLSGCSFVPIKISPAVHSFVSTSLRLERVQDAQRRYNVSSREEISTCPVEVIVKRPIVNLLPLSIFLVVTVVVNVVFTIATSAYGNTLDCYFHIVKEVFGHDCLSNPLQKSQGVIVEQEEIALQLTVRDNIGYVGFLGGENGLVVEDFSEETVVCDTL